MRTSYRSSYQSKVLLCCLLCGAFSLGFFCGLFSNSWSSETFITGRNAWQPDVRRKEEKTVRTVMMVVVFSSPSNALRRKIIRKTWLSTPSHDQIRHFFVIGKAALASHQQWELDREQRDYKDLLLLEGLTDSYESLSAKLLECFTWIAHNAEFVFLLKVDDDSYVQLPELYSQLRARNQTERLYLGFFDGRARAKKRGQWAERNWFLCDRYLPYALGGGYVLTSDLVRYVAQNRDLLKLYRSEDVSLGVWLAALELNRVHDTNFDTEYQSRGCFNSYVVTHKQSPQQMVDKFNYYIKYGKMCKSEIRNRNSYVYNWNTLPSLCCHRNNSNVP